jgi:hypothetical protein
MRLDASKELLTPTPSAACVLLELFKASRCLNEWSARMPDKMAEAQPAMSGQGAAERPR